MRTDLNDGYFALYSTISSEKIRYGKVNHLNSRESS